MALPEIQEPEPPSPSDADASDAGESPIGSSVGSLSSASEDVAAGLLPDATYRRLLSPLRYRLRQVFLRALSREMPYLPKLQSRCREWGGPRLDEVMVRSSWLGSHTFFMCFLPMCFWFGHYRFGAGMIFVLAASVFVTGYVKDFICLPRPYSPPVIRLSIGTHAAEYGFPSTHSATSFASALWILEAVHSSSSFGQSVLAHVLVAVYIVVLVFGRLYCGMHSFQDVLVGTLIGSLVYLLYSTFADRILELASSPSLLVPLYSVAFTLVGVSVHPQPVDNCPCFEDSTAFISVGLGMVLSAWSLANFPLPPGAYYDPTIEPPPSSPHIAVFAAAAVAKMVIGVASIFLWRLSAKAVLSRVLPPIFRAVQVEIPRRHYVPATDYDRYEAKEGAIIPSVLDLHAPVSADVDARATSLHPNLQNRKAGALDVDPLVLVKRRREREEEKRPAHYDVEVLMRIIVYTGICFLSVYPLPWFFLLTGLT